MKLNGWVWDTKLEVPRDVEWSYGSELEDGEVIHFSMFEDGRVAVKVDGATYVLKWRAQDGMLKAMSQKFLSFEHIWKAKNAKSNPNL